MANYKFHVGDRVCASDTCPKKFKFKGVRRIEYIYAHNAPYTYNLSISAPEFKSSELVAAPPLKKKNKKKV